MSHTRAVLVAAMLAAGACVSGAEKQPVTRASLIGMALPDMARSPESVRAQLRDAHARLRGVLDNVNSTDAERATAFGELGKLFFAAEYNAAAESAFLNAETLAPADASWPYFLGHLHRTRGDAEKAVACFERSLRLKPDDVPALVWLGAAYLDQGRPHQARPHFTRALSVWPGVGAAQYGLGRAALAIGDYAAAVTHFEAALESDRRATIIHYPLAMAYRGLGKTATAEAHLRQRGDVEIGPPDPLMQEVGNLLESAMAHEHRGVRALENGQYPLAIDHFRRGLALEPDTASLHHRLGTALYLAGDPEGGLEELEATLRLSPQYAQAHFSIGAILASRGRYAEAIERFAATLDSEPAHLEARLAIADTLLGTGRAREALPHYERLLQIDATLESARRGYRAAMSAQHRQASTARQ